MTHDIEYDSGIGHFDDVAVSGATERKHTIIQSLWTKPILQGEKPLAWQKARMRETLFLAALSLAYAHRSGYKVHMHTDSKGAELLKGFGYEKLQTTLDRIPDTVPTELFAAGKFYALLAEGVTGKVHVDIDVLLKKPGVLERFYSDKRVDAVCQMEEDMSLVRHDDKIKHMYVLGYPVFTRPDWRGSMNTGVVGFNNYILAMSYMRNYSEALDMYTAERFEAYRAEMRAAKQQEPNLHFDFVLEQIALSHMSLGYNVQTLVPTKSPSFVADKIGYQHLQGSGKWSSGTQNKIKSKLRKLDPKLYGQASIAARKIKD